MLIYETLSPIGEPIYLNLERGEDGLEIVTDEYRASVSPRVIETIMRRYGRELEPSVVVDGESIELGDGMVLRRFRFRAAVDAEGRDYLALVEPEAPVIAVFASHLAATLEHLVKAAD